MAKTRKKSGGLQRYGWGRDFQYGIGVPGIVALSDGDYIKLDDLKILLEAGDIDALKRTVQAPTQSRSQP